MDLTQGKVSSQIFRFSIPIIIMQVLNQAYSIADSVIVSRFAGKSELSSLSAAMAVLSVGYCLINGAGAACHILIANRFGQKQFQKVKNIYKTILSIGTCFALMLALAYILLGKWLFQITKLPDSLFDTSMALLSIYAVSFIVQIICSVQCSVLNGIGDSKTPMYICTATQILNILLDIFAVIFLKGGAVGAAYASVFSLCVAVACTQFVLNQKLSAISADKAVLDMEILIPYIKLTIPSLLQQSVMSIGSLILQRLVNVHGIEAMTGYTVAININNFLILPVIAYTSAFETFAAQNMGSMNFARVKEGFRSLLLQCGIICIGLSAATIFLAEPMISLYLSNPLSEAFQFAKEFTFVLIANFFLLLLKYGIDALFKANMKVYLFTLSSLVSLTVRVLFSYLFADTFGLISLAYGMLIGNAVAILFSLPFYKKISNYSVPS